MKRLKAKKLALGALISAMVTLATILSVPVPGFRLYFNLGEGIIYTVAILMGPGYGAVCGGLGASMADLILGYPLWAPATLIIKGLEGYAVGKLAPRNRVLAMLAGAAIMTISYSTMAGILYGKAAMPVEFITDITQTGIGMIVALPLSNILKHRLKQANLLNRG